MTAHGMQLSGCAPKRLHVLFCAYRDLKAGRVTLASTESHVLVEEVLKQQLVMEEAVAKASNTVDRLAEKMDKQRGWMNNEEMPFIKAIVNAGGKTQFSFDGVIEVGQAGKLKLVLVETKHSVSDQDLRDANGKLFRLRNLLHAIKDGTEEPGARLSYRMQTHHLKELCDYELQLCMGGQSFDKGVEAKAHEAGCMVVKPDGGRYGVSYATPAPPGFSENTAYNNVAPTLTRTQLELDPNQKGNAICVPGLNVFKCFFDAGPCVVDAAASLTRNVGSRGGPHSQLLVVLYH